MDLLEEVFSPQRLHSPYPLLSHPPSSVSDSVASSSSGIVSPPLRLSVHREKEPLEGQPFSQPRREGGGDIGIIRREETSAWRDLSYRLRKQEEEIAALRERLESSHLSPMTSSSGVLGGNSVDGGGGALHVDSTWMDVQDRSLSLSHSDTSPDGKTNRVSEQRASIPVFQRMRVEPLWENAFLSSVQNDAKHLQLTSFLRDIDEIQPSPNSEQRVALCAVLVRGLQEAIRTKSEENACVLVVRQEIADSTGYNWFLEASQHGCWKVFRKLLLSRNFDPYGSFPVAFSCVVRSENVELLSELLSSRRPDASSSVVGAQNLPRLDPNYTIDSICPLTGLAEAVVLNDARVVESILRLGVSTSFPSVGGAHPNGFSLPRESSPLLLSVDEAGGGCNIEVVRSLLKYKARISTVYDLTDAWDDELVVDRKERDFGLSSHNPNKLWFVENLYVVRLARHNGFHEAADMIVAEYESRSRSNSPFNPQVGTLGSVQRAGFSYQVSEDNQSQIIPLGFLWKSRKWKAGWSERYFAIDVTENCLVYCYADAKDSSNIDRLGLSKNRASSFLPLRQCSVSVDFSQQTIVLFLHSDTFTSKGHSNVYLKMHERSIFTLRRTASLILSCSHLFL